MSCNRRTLLYVRARGVTLIEAILVVLVLAIAVPVGMRMITESNEVRRQSADTARAITLTAGVLEHITADSNASSGGLGFSAFDDSSAYLTTATTGLYDRLATMTAPYSTDGITYDVVIGPLADATGTVTGDTNEDVFREITVRVTFPDPDGGSLTMPTSIVLTDLGS
ncbi:MAG: hypothetical protein DHS20C14_10480 [Phycisphaeraceae bacterium]|nr:MAG: hypothetical protein DHS20C14_10480 [Phycisphaeraceae bacterium]